MTTVTLPLCESLVAFKESLQHSRWVCNINKHSSIRRIMVAIFGSHLIDQNTYAARLALLFMRETLPVYLENLAILIPHYAGDLKHWAKEAKEADIYSAETIAWNAKSACFFASNKTSELDVMDLAKQLESACWHIANALSWEPEHATREIVFACQDMCAFVAASDKLLAQLADIAVQILIELKCEGTLYLES